MATRRRAATKQGKRRVAKTKPSSKPKPRPKPKREPKRRPTSPARAAGRASKVGGAAAKTKRRAAARPARQPSVAFDEAETQKVSAAEVVEDIEIQLSLDLLPNG
ncbi:MAG: hypothetical protein MUC96_09385 [Myxococcaceae bacterium]|jgi:hypothetical protein|nr:hypothetical protein [Myxococcaceae bacterium]